MVTLSGFHFFSLPFDFLPLDSERIRVQKKRFGFGFGKKIRIRIGPFPGSGTQLTMAKERTVVPLFPLFAENRINH